jgi:hypothetical protein
MDEASPSALIDKLVRQCDRIPVEYPWDRSGDACSTQTAAYALADLDRGKVVPLLARKKAAHRPPVSYAKEAFRAVVAGAMDAVPACQRRQPC